MNRLDHEAIEIFREQFGDVVDRRQLSSEIYDGRVLPEALLDFYDQIGIGRRADGFIWLIDPHEFLWMRDIFDIEGYIPFARTSFDNVFLLDQKGAAYELSASYGEMNQITLDLETTVLGLSDGELTDDEFIYARHAEEWESGNTIDESTCYCLRPAIPLGGSYEDSDIYVGKTRVYFDILAQSQMRVHDS